MIIGEKRQASLWFSTDEQAAKAEIAIREVFEAEEEDLGVVYSPVVFEVHTCENAPYGYKALVGEAYILNVGTEKIDTQWLMELNPSELKLLRDVTQRAFKHICPEAPDLPVHNLDQIIASRGPHVARRLCSH